MQSYWGFIDQLLLIVAVILLITVMDTILTLIEKEQYIKWVNFLGLILILSLIMREILDFLHSLRTLLHRL
ncbi:hypothetical protein CULT_60104 [[Clostridium] ultunense Esp]|uniref:hypothetical protein n=1 Tax=Thermicanus aegyptius TaxID=94009 RepID=UPI0002B6F393|nr:hypothetical protein [Thermicanus aegyptius]CCQ97319.1 hypothetical protein CULT_60104 [[Clostridium] ultunense Esp]